ncbi:hypothetical protein HF1_12870 [Mycoplasma haemofelis str. Langford 1]|uniref:Uncharacterized protein n=1 Tax=Mycoplasma haemofelis (strain Langford 1) TaxID=941640 RepID=E8ZJH4_MYCHL|nr:hypothetical protein [Mycoplasma haemofelis]CBY93295.1 hypothetical protein HF1_12870 [Mycoplasma haemofelis str. Langford 1]
MTSLAKGALGLGGIGTVAGGGALAWQQGAFSSKVKSIKEKLISENYQILDSSNSSWDSIFNVYKKTENQWKFKNDGISESSATTEIQKLKDKCFDALKGDSEDADEYYKASKWCVVPRKVESFLDASSLLNTEESDNTDTSAWEKSLTSFKETKTGDSGNVKYAMENITIQEPENDSKKTENIKAMKGGCKSRRDKWHYELDFEKSLTEVKKWCSR